MMYVEDTIVVSGPKRSGTTLMNRLFDSHPGVVDLVDEAFFWEHVHNYEQRGLETLFVSLFRRFDPGDLAKGMMDRDILPWVDGIYRQPGVAYQQELDLKFDSGVFLRELGKMRGCTSVEEIWDCLVWAYAQASAPDYSACHTALIKAADYGKSILSAQRSLKRCTCIFIIRNPFSAIDSLKKSRELRKAKLLHPFNLAEVIADYLFFWKNRASILGERTKLVRFEDLLSSPEPVMREVAGHAGVEYAEGLISPTLRGNTWVGLSSFSRTTEIDPSILLRKLQVLTGQELDFIGQSLRDLLDYFDYRE